MYVYIYILQLETQTTWTQFPKGLWVSWFQSPKWWVLEHWPAINSRQATRPSWPTCQGNCGPKSSVQSTWIDDMEGSLWLKLQSWVTWKKTVQSISSVQFRSVHDVSLCHLREKTAPRPSFRMRLRFSSLQSPRQALHSAPGHSFGIKIGSPERNWGLPSPPFAENCRSHLQFSDLKSVFLNVLDKCPHGFP